MTRSRRGRSVVALGVFALVVGLALTGLGGAHPATDGVLAQQAPNNTTAGATTTGTATPMGNATGNTTGNASGGGGFGFGIDIDPVEMFMDMLGGLADAFLDVGTGSVDALNEIVFGIPAPGDIDNPTSLSNPDDPIWAALYGAWPLTMVVGLPLYALAIASTFAATDERARRRGYKRLALGGLMMLLAPVIPALILNTANEITSALAPSGSEFFATPGNLGRLGAGLGVGLILALFNAGAIGVGLVVLAMEQVLVYVTVYLWMVAWAGYANAIGIIRSLGQTIIYLFSVVVAAKVIQALIARFLFTLPFDGGGATPLITLLMTVGGVAFTFIIFPKSMLDHANDSASVSLGMSSAEQRGGEFAERSVERVRDRVSGSFQSHRSPDDAATRRGGDTGGWGGESGQRVGSVQTGSVSLRSGSMARARTGGDTPAESPGSAGGIDADDWAAQREHVRRDRTRGFD